MLRGVVPQPGRREYFTIVLLGLEILVFALASPYFLTGDNISTVLRSATTLAAISIGMTMVIVMGGIDVSVGPAMGVAAIAGARLMEANMSWPVVVLGAVATGVGIGLLNGALVAFARIPPIIATLGTMSLLEAAVFGLLNGQWITGLPPTFSTLITGTWLGLPSSVFVLLVPYAVFWYLLTFRAFGRHIYAVGNSPEAATLAGIRVKRVQVLTFGILGALVGGAALLYLGLMASVEITVGSNLAIQSIAAVVIGGTAITGGRGSIVGTLAGVLFMAIMQNGIVLLGIPSLWENAIIGTLVLLSIAFDRLVEVGLRRRHEARRWAVRRGLGETGTEGAVESAPPAIVSKP
jgi:ribose transport system permease protein/AI-2 transport system permease protein